MVDPKETVAVVLEFSYEGIFHHSFRNFTAATRILETSVSWKEHHERPEQGEDSCGPSSLSTSPGVLPASTVSEQDKNNVAATLRLKEKAAQSSPLY